MYTQNKCVNTEVLGQSIAGKDVCRLWSEKKTDVPSNQIFCLPSCLWCMNLFLMRILKLRLGSLFGENHPPFRSYWSLSILRGVPVQLYIRLEPRCCTCIKVRDRTVAGRWWWCALNDYLAIAQFVRGHRSAGNNLSCHQMFRSVTIHLKWIFFSFSNTLQKVRLHLQFLKR